MENNVNAVEFLNHVLLSYSPYKIYSTDELEKANPSLFEMCQERLCRTGRLFKHIVTHEVKISDCGLRWARKIDNFMQLMKVMKNDSV